MPFYCIKQNFVVFTLKSTLYIELLENTWGVTRENSRPSRFNALRATSQRVNTFMLHVFPHPAMCTMVARKFQGSYFPMVCDHLACVSI